MDPPRDSVIRVYSGTDADFVIDRFINYMHEDVKNGCISKYIYVGNKCFPSDGHGHGINFPGRPVYNASFAVFQKDGTEDYVINTLTAYQWQPGSPF